MAENSPLSVVLVPMVFSKIVRGGATQEGKHLKKEPPKLDIPYATSSWSALMVLLLSQTLAMEMVKTNTIMAITTESPIIPVVMSGRVGGGIPREISPTTGISNLDFRFPKYDTIVPQITNIRSIGIGMYSLDLNFSFIKSLKNIRIMIQIIDVRMEPTLTVLIFLKISMYVFISFPGPATNGIRTPMLFGI